MSEDLASPHGSLMLSLKQNSSKKRNSSDFLNDIDVPVKRMKIYGQNLEIIKKDDPRCHKIMDQVETNGYVLTYSQGNKAHPDWKESVSGQNPTIINIVSMSQGRRHVVCLSDEGSVLTFGSNNEGALGREVSEYGVTVPGFVHLPAPAIQVTAGDTHSCALLKDGRVYCWGSFQDSHGLLGLITGKQEISPVNLEPGKRFTQIMSGADHIILLDNTGTMFTLGCAEQGQLGRLPEKKTGRNSSRGKNSLLVPTPVQIKMKKNSLIKKIWAGRESSYAEDIHGNVFVFGNNYYGQLGLRKGGRIFWPQVVNTLSGYKWAKITPPQRHNIHFAEKREVYILGKNMHTVLGLGTVKEDATEVVHVPTIRGTKCMDVAVGTAQSIAVTKTGKMYTWGTDSDKEFKTGKKNEVLKPQLISSELVKDFEFLLVSELHDKDSDFCKILLS
ncbi:regulator of chromosome condensation-like [Copidosoma floridanum]|uniref:regulator of chromosome condensation-like n=1 Tax=Copidosoma floridanum TaxID=29053 RepID=UPI0006C963F5|nr:regulator of chromosome condensation-like [Copidosoma floridanum]